MSAPAVLVALPLLAGVVAGALSGMGSRVGLIVLAVAWVAAAAGLWRGRGLAVLGATIVGCLAAGVALGSRAAGAATNPPLLGWFHESASRDRPVRVTAVLREDATFRPGSGQAGTATGVSVTVDVVEAEGRRVDGGVRVTIAGALAAGVRQDWRAGRTVVLSVLLREPLDYRDPGYPAIERGWRDRASASWDRSRARRWLRSRRAARG